MSKRAKSEGRKKAGDEGSCGCGCRVWSAMRCTRQ
jgi:hypothetical protein